MSERLRVLITADSSNFKSVVRDAKKDLRQLGSAGGSAGGSISTGMTDGATKIKSIGDELSSLSGNIASGNAVAIASVGSLSEAVLSYSGNTFGAVKNTIQMREAAKLAADSALNHHQQLSKQYKSVLLAGNGSTQYAASLREQISASTKAVKANRAHAKSLSPLKAGLGALGGPAGLITMAATAAGLWFISTRNSADEAEKLAEKNVNLADSFRDVSASVLAQKIVQYSDALSQVKDRESFTGRGQVTYFEGKIAEYTTKINTMQEAEDRVREVLNAIGEKRKAANDGGNDAAAFSLVSPEFDEDIGAKSFEDRIEYLGEHNLLVREIIAEHNRLIREETEENNRLMLEDELRMQQERLDGLGWVTEQMLSLEQQRTQGALYFMQALGQKSKAFAIAAFIAEKAIAVKRILVQTNVAAVAALTPPPIGLGPVLGQGLAAQIRATGTGTALLTGAASIAEGINRFDGGASSTPAASIGGGASGGVIGSDNTSANESPYQGSTELRFVFQFSERVSEEIVVKGFPAAINKQRLVIEGGDGVTYTDFRIAG